MTGVIQGIGLSFSFMPVTMIAFATLPSRFRTDASGLTMLFRNVGSSIGIAGATVLLARNIQINHAEIGSRLPAMLNPFAGDMNSAFAPLSGMALGTIDAMVNQQAAMIAYLDDFMLMSLGCLAAIPLLLLVKPGKKPAATDTVEIAAEVAH